MSVARHFDLKGSPRCGLSVSPPDVCACFQPFFVIGETSIPDLIVATQEACTYRLAVQAKKYAKSHEWLEYSADKTTGTFDLGPPLWGFN